MVLKAIWITATSCVHKKGVIPELGSGIAGDNKSFHEHRQDQSLDYCEYLGNLIMVIAIFGFVVLNCGTRNVWDFSRQGILPFISLLFQIGLYILCVISKGGPDPHCMLPGDKIR